MTDTSFNADPADETAEWTEPPPALGAVIEQGRGALPFRLLHGEALVACAAWGLGSAGVTPVDLGTPWSSIVEAGEPLVLHDSLCPMVPPQFIAACVTEALERDAVVLGVRPVTDTVKTVEQTATPHEGDHADGERDEADAPVLGPTVDRDGLWSVVSPLVLPARVVADLAELADPGPRGLDPGLDFAVLAAALAERDELVVLEAPAAARRVVDEDDLEVLAALTSPDR